MNIKYSFLQQLNPTVRYCLSKPTIALENGRHNVTLIIMFLLCMFLFNMPSGYATAYYSTGSNAPNLKASWKSNTNDTGTSPSNFTNSADIFIVQSGHSMTTGADWSVTGKVQVNSGGALVLSNYNVTIAGGLTINGTVQLSSNSGTKAFTGDVALNSGAVWNETAGATVSFGGNFTNNGTFTANSGAHTFSGTSKLIGGTNSISIPSATFSGTYNNTGMLTCSTLLTVSGTLTNNGTVEATTALSGTGSLVQGANSTLNILGTSGITTLTATATDNTVNYNGSGNQSIHSGNYFNLTLSTSGTKTLLSGTTGIGGDFIIDNVTTSAVTGLTIGGDVILNRNFNFTTGNFTHNLGGNWTINGWGTTNATIGNTLNFVGSNSAINGTSNDATKANFYNITVSKDVGATLSLAGVFTGINVGGNFTLVSGAFSNGNTQVKISGNWSNNGGVLMPGSGYVTMAGASKTIGGTVSTTFNNIEIGSYQNSTIFLGKDIIVNGNISFLNAKFQLGGCNFTLGATATVSGSFYSSNMIVTDGTGEVRKVFLENGSFTFPVGDVSSNYSPATVNMTGSSYAEGAYVSLRVTNAKEPNNPSSNNYITRYWTVNQSGITSAQYNFTGSSLYGADNVGNRENSLAAIYGDNSWTVFTVPAGDTFGINGLTIFGNITTINNVPIINTSSSSLSDFRYGYGYGPSNEQSFSVSGSNVSSNIVITAPSNYEISTVSGAGFAGSITLNATNKNLAATTIYVRLKAGLAVNTYTQNISLKSGTTTATVSATGVVFPEPCPYSGNSSSGITIVPIVDMTSYVNQVSASFATKNYFILNVIKGLTYQIYTCSSPSGPLKISVYEEGNSANFIASSISNTGNSCNNNSNNVYLSFVSPLSGQVRVLLNGRTNCSANISGLTVNVNVSEGSNTQDDANAAGNDTWIGHIYDGAGVFTNYIGYYNTTAFSGKSDEFKESFGTGGTFPNCNNDDATSFNVYSNGVVRAKILDVTYSVRYKMNSTKRGLWTFDVASDDGVKLSVDGVLQYSYWNIHAPVTNTNMLISLTGSSSLIFDFYENDGQNIVGFYNLKKIISNELTTNKNQTICLGNTSGGLAIGGDILPVSLPSGLSLNGTGYTWSYSTTPDGTRTLISGATGATYTPTGASPFNVPGTYYVYRNVSINSSYNSGTYPFNANETNESTPAIIIVKACNNYWVGTTSTNWGTSSNWKAGYIPSSGEDVEFATADNNSGVAAVNDLQLDVNRTIGSLINLSSKKLIIPVNKSLVISGTATTTGDAGQIQINADTSSPNGSLIFLQPVLNKSVNATIQMYSKGFKGDVITWDDNGTTYTSSYRWQYFGLPLQSVVANPTFSGSWVREYSEPLNSSLLYQKWTQLDNSSVLKPFRGYEVTQDAPKTITFQGTLFVGDTVLNLTVSGGYGSGYNIFGNSYVGAIDISKIQFPPSGVEKTVYVYNTGTFSEWGSANNQAGTYYAIPQQTASITGDKIASMQGFLLIATANNSKVTIPYSSASNNNRAQRAKGVEKMPGDSDLSYIKMEVQSDNTYDATWIFESEEASRAFDNGWDGYKLLNSDRMSLYSDEEIGKLQVNSLNTIDEVYVGFKAGEDTQYTMTIAAKNLLEKYGSLYMKDLITGSIVKLDDKNVTYHFTASSATPAEKRFLIRGIEKDIDEVSPLVITTQKGNYLIIKNNGEVNGRLYVYDTIGRIVAEDECAAKSTVELNRQLEEGVYLISFITEKGKKYNRKVIMP
ncbi:MAG: hypothetical protein QM751_07750 [Paludibacteraceae bacterium]